jgi:hypothetical protein
LVPYFTKIGLVNDVLLKSGTLNKEFINEFGSWSIGSAGKSLQDELVALL